MKKTVAELMNRVRHALAEAHRGVLPHAGRLLAFGSRGELELKPFRKWLRGKGYAAKGFATDGESWVLLVEPPKGMRDTRGTLIAFFHSPVAPPLPPLAPWTPLLPLPLAPCTLLRRCAPCSPPPPPLCVL